MHAQYQVVGKLDSKGLPAVVCRIRIEQEVILTNDNWSKVETIVVNKLGEHRETRNVATALKLVLQDFSSLRDCGASRLVRGKESAWVDIEGGISPTGFSMLADAFADQQSMRVDYAPQEVFVYTFGTSSLVIPLSLQVARDLTDSLNKIKSELEAGQAGGGVAPQGSSLVHPLNGGAAAAVVLLVATGIALLAGYIEHRIAQDQDAKQRRMDAEAGEDSFPSKSDTGRDASDRVHESGGGGSGRPVLKERF